MTTRSIPAKIIPWWLLLLQGLAVIVLGILLIANPGRTLIALAILVGVYWFVDGCISIGRIFTGRSRTHWAWSLVIGILGILAGIFVLTHLRFSSILGPTVLVIILAIEGLALGTAEIVRGSLGGGAADILVGVFNILIGLWLFFFPRAAVFSLPFVLGSLGIFFGIYLITCAVQAARKPRSA